MDESQAASNDALQMTIATALDVLGDTHSEESRLVPESELYDFILNNLTSDEQSRQKFNEKAFRLAFISALHGHKNSIFLYESDIDQATGEMKWKLRQETQDAMSVNPAGIELRNSKNSNPNSQIEEMQKELKILRLHVNKIETEIQQYTKVYEHMKSIAPPEIQRNIENYETYSRHIDTIGSQLKDVESQMMDIGQKIPRFEDDM